MNSFRFLFDLPAYQAYRTPQRVAGGMWRQGIKEEISSEQLSELVNRIAKQFINDGVKRGDRVVLLTDRYSIKWLATDMAIMAAGAISCPLNHPVRKVVLDIILRRLEPAVIIHTSSVEFEDPFESKHILFEDLISEENTNEESDLQKLKIIRDGLHQDDIATIVHTSGSSGEPRAVCLTHSNIVSNVMSELSIVPFIAGT